MVLAMVALVSRKTGATLQAISASVLQFRISSFRLIVNTHLLLSPSGAMTSPWPLGFLDMLLGVVDDARVPLSQLL
jgi:hypothetical protein